ncbi:hypothetical protein C8Q76DRAFT_852916 [Earliella scabrosa]|nr:hypothetical protein C8Q76DRAFT_852916 [Earliella scabrosa]
MSTPPHLPAFSKDARTQCTQTPNPAFTTMVTYGHKVDRTEKGRRWIELGQETGWMVVGTASEDPRDLSKLMISGIVPRPIALESPLRSLSEDGTENLAPQRSKTLKEFTVNLLSDHPFPENGDMASMDRGPRSISEWPLMGLTKKPNAPCVKESVSSMECEASTLPSGLPIKCSFDPPYAQLRVFHAHNIVDTPVSGEHTTTLIHVRNDVLNERGVVDISKLRPAVGHRLGDISYAHVRDAFHLWMEEGEKAQ